MGTTFFVGTFACEQRSNSLQVTGANGLNFTLGEHWFAASNPDADLPPRKRPRLS